VFYINVPIGIVALAVTTAVLPNSIARAKPVLDYAGFVLLGSAITCIVLITTWGGGQYAWDSGVIISLTVAAVVLIAAFVLTERGAQEPVIPLHLFQDRTFTISSLVSLVVGLAMFGSIIYLPLYLQLVTGASATDSGLLLLPLMGGLLLTSIASGQVISRTGRYKIFPVVGMALAIVGMWLLSTMDVATSRTVSSGYMFVLGAGIGLVMQVMVLATQNSVNRSDLGTATAAVSFFRSVGGSLGVSLFGALFNTRLAGELARDLPQGVHVDGAVSNSVSAIRSLPAAVRSVYESAYADSLTYVFAIAVPILIAGFVATLFLKEKPMATTLD
jgi:Na+/melibiose symporter-like transporter